MRSIEGTQSCHYGLVLRGERLRVMEEPAERVRDLSKGGENDRSIVGLRLMLRVDRRLSLVP